MTDTTTQAVTALQIADLLGGLTVTGYRSTWTCDLPALMVQEVIAHAETQLRNLTAERDALAAQLAAAEARAREASLDALAAYGQAADAHAAQLAAEAKLATARGEALEEAARYHDKCEADEIAVSAKYRGGSNPWFAHVQSAKWHANDAAAIRALAKGES